LVIAKEEPGDAGKVRTVRSFFRKWEESGKRRERRARGGKEAAAGTWIGFDFLMQSITQRPTGDGGLGRVAFCPVPFEICEPQNREVAARGILDPALSALWASSALQFSLRSYVSLIVPCIAPS
jgi:hypothetical protein